MVLIIFVENAIWLSRDFQQFFYKIKKKIFLEEL